MKEVRRESVAREPNVSGHIKFEEITKIPQCEKNPDAEGDRCSTASVEQEWVLGLFLHRQELLLCDVRSSTFFGACLSTGGASRERAMRRVKDARRKTTADRSKYSSGIERTRSG